MPIEILIVEEVKPIERELYLSAVVDRGSKRIMFMASEEGGMDIEEVAEKTPEKILLAAIDPVAGLQPYQCRNMAFKMGLEGKQVGQLFKVMSALLNMFVAKDASQVEINPLVVNGDGDLMALDAKVIWMITQRIVTQTWSRCVIHLKKMRKNTPLSSMT